MSGFETVGGEGGSEGGDQGFTSGNAEQDHIEGAEDAGLAGVGNCHRREQDGQSVGDADERVGGRGHQREGGHQLPDHSGFREFVTGVVGQDFIHHVLLQSAHEKANHRGGSRSHWATPGSWQLHRGGASAQPEERRHTVLTAAWRRRRRDHLLTVPYWRK